MNNIISDETKCSEIKEPIQVYSMRVEDKINNFIRKLKNMPLLNDQTYKSLFVTGSGPGILYGLPKTHKADFANSYHPGIFSLHTTALPISSLIFLFQSSPLPPMTTLLIILLLSVKKISAAQNADNLFMTSFDVENLFTNISLHETITICFDYLFPDDSSGSNVLGLSRKLFKTLLELSVLNSFFSF